MDESVVDGSMRLGRQREFGGAQCWALARKVALGLSLALACQSALAQAMYRIKPIVGPGGCAASASGFNDADEVTGQACNANGDFHAFLWKNDGKPMLDLGPDELGSWSDASGITASGLIAGDAGDSTGDFGFMSSGDGTPMTKIVNTLNGGTIDVRALSNGGWVTGTAYSTGDGLRNAFLWRNDGSSMLNIDPYNDWSDGYAVNDAGRVVFDAGEVSENDAEGYIWKNGADYLLYPLPTGTTSWTCCINASGQVAGGSTTHNRTRAHAVLWTTDGTAHDLGTLGGAESYATAINDIGQVAGNSYTTRFLKSHAFIWLNNGTPMKDLGTFGGSSSQSNDINASGQVTGSANLTGDSVAHAFLWRNDGTTTQDLNKLIDPTDPLKPYVTLTNGLFINGIGDIVAYGTDSRTGLTSSYLLQGTVLTLSPRSLAFGNQKIKTSSAAKSVTVTNTSAKAVAITSIALTGTAAGQFATTSNCGKSLASRTTCTIKVTFKPTTRGAKSATLNVNGGGGGLRAVTLTGMGS